jgi:hypothetical protein
MQKRGIDIQIENGWKIKYAHLFISLKIKIIFLVTVFELRGA